MKQPAFNTTEDYLDQLSRYLPEQRVQHSVNVARAAHKLAQLHGPGLERKAWVAGLLHDNAKSMEPAELKSKAQELGISISAEEASKPALLHGRVGAGLLPERFGVSDAEIGMAVADHVTGRPGMGLLSLILFVADQTAADRDFKGVAALRELARGDLVKAAAQVCRYKMMYILNAGKPVILETVALYNELQARTDGAGE